MSETMDVLRDIEQRQQELLAAMSTICFPDDKRFDDIAVKHPSRKWGNMLKSKSSQKFLDDLPDETVNYDDVPEGCSW